MKYCRICFSKNKEDIENLLLKGELTKRDIAKQYLNSFECNLHLLEQSVATHKDHMGKPLSREDRELLDRFGRGEVSLEETSRIVASKAFERMFKHPDSGRFIDFFRMELLKLKLQENKKKDNWGKDLLSRLFVNGKLPPKYCPHCGKLLVEDTIALPESEDQKEVEEVRLDNG